jgi:short-subunit dehydrogenase
MTSIVLPMMVAKHKGVVINIASASGTNPSPLLTVYSSCKVSVEQNINATEICHGVIVSIHFIKIGFKN